MIPNNKAFNGKNHFECDGKTYCRWHYIRNSGAYQLRIRWVSEDSKHCQAVALFFSSFDGSITWNGRRLETLKGFQHYLFKKEDFVSNEILLSVYAKKGSLFIANASERKETGSFTCGAFGNAFWLEQIDDETIRFYCNDHEYDDDFTDLIFDLSIIPEG